MLGFSALSEAPLAASSVTEDAIAYAGTSYGISYAGTLGVAAQTTLAYAAAAFATGSLGVSGQTTLSTTIASTGIHQFTAFDDVRGAFGAYPNGAATSSFTIATVTVNGKANTTPSAVTVLSSAGVLDYDAKANIILDTASASADLTVNVSDFGDEDAQGKAVLSSVYATSYANWDTVNGIYAISVIYSNTDFERTRTVNIVPYGNYTVYVTR